MTLYQTREDHGTPHSGKYAAYVRVSTDDQDVKNQEASIKAYLDGGDHKVKWFREEGVSSGTDWHLRHELHNCFEYCRKNNATMVVYSLDRLSRTMWETLRFFDQEVSTGKMKLVIVDDPTITDPMTLSMKAMMAQHERRKIRERTKAALGRIQEEIKEKGYHITKAGKKINKLGVHDKQSEASKKGNSINKAKADARAEDVWPIIERLLDQKVSYRGIACELNKMQIPTPSKRRNPNLSRRTKWYPTSVRNYALRGLVLKTKTN